MVRDDIAYNPERDIQEVVQFGFIDLKAANVSSSIPVLDGLDDEKFNGVSDPRSLGFMPKDVFEAMQANKAIVGYKAPETKDEE